MPTPLIRRARRWRLPAIRAARLGAAGAAAFAATAFAAVTASLTSSNATPVAGGAAFALTLTLTNDATPDSDLVATLPMPSAINVSSMSVSGTDAGAVSCRVAAPAPSTVVCRAPSFAANATATVTVVALVAADTASGVRTATARVTASGAQTTASTALTLTVNAPLSVSKNVPSTTTAGAPMAYTITVSNTGSTSAINAVVTDPLPAGFDFLGLAARGALDGACHFNPATRELRCDVPTLPSGNHEVTVLVEPNGNLAAGSAGNSTTLNAASGTVVTGSVSTSTQLAHSRIDVDKNAAYEARFDGALIVRYLLGVAPSPLITSAVGANAKRTTASQIAEYLDFIRTQLDVDGDGAVRALSDGLLMVRYLLGLRGNALIAGAVAPGASRTTIAALEAYLAALTPP